MTNTADSISVRIAVLSGGVGGAKFAAGLHAALPPGELAVIVNTADDFDHLGLRICPDLDSMLYGLADIHDTTRGWGRRGESWNCLQTLGELGAHDWFALGDRDLAVHLVRSDSLRQGRSLAEVTAGFTRAYGIQNTILPMTESRVETILITSEGELSMQDYFVRRRCAPSVQALRYRGAEKAEFHPRAQAILQSSELRAVFIAPSNPFLSIDPILALPGVRGLLREASVPVVAISPLISGKSLKGPLSDMLTSMGLGSTTQAIAHHYDGLIDALVLDASDARDADGIRLPILATTTRMSDHETRRSLALAALNFLEQLGHG